MVGRNGAGKSTLLKLCTGQLVPDGGRIVWQGGIRVGCLDQYAALNPEHTMGEVLHGAFRPLYALERAMTELYDRAAAGDRVALAAAARRQEELEARGFYEVDTRVEKAAAGLGLAELGLDRPVGELSGGQRASCSWPGCCWRSRTCCCWTSPPTFWTRSRQRGWRTR